MGIRRDGIHGVRPVAVFGLCILIAFAVLPPTPLGSSPAQAAEVAGGPVVRLDASMPSVPSTPAVGGAQRVMDALFSCPGVAGAQLSASGQALGEGLADLMSGGGAPGSRLADAVTLGTSDQPCATPTGLVPVPKNLSCTSPQLMSNGRFDPTKLRRFRQSLEAQLRPLQCREGRINTLMAESQCLAEGMRSLEQQVNQLNQIYTQNIQRMNQDMAGIAEVEADYQAQIDEARRRLGSIEGSATTGIAQSAHEIGQAMQGMDSEIANARQQALAVRQQRRAFEEQISRAQMGYAAECVRTTKRSDYRCVKNGPVVTAMEHLRCLYEQRGRISEGQRGARVETDTATVREGAGNVAALDSVMERIFKDIASPEPPANAAAASQAGEPRANSFMERPQQILERYGAELDALSRSGVDVKGFVMSTFSSCFRRSEAAVQRARNGADNRWAAVAAQIQSMEEQSRAQIQQQIDRYADMYERAVGALTLGSKPMNVQACRRGSMDNATACLSEIRQVLEGVVRGTNQFGRVNMTIKGTNAQRAVNFTCSGLAGCARDLDRMIRNRTQHLTQLQGVRTQYVNQARNNLNTFTNQMRQFAQPAIARMRGRMEMIARGLASTGVRGLRIDLTPMQREELRPAEGIPQVPADPLALIAGGPNGVPRVDANFFLDLSSQLSDGRAEIQREKDEVMARASEVDGLLGQCREEAVSTLVDSLNQISTGVGNGGCDRAQFCQRSGPLGNLGNLVSSLNLGGSGDAGGAEAALAGYSDACGGGETEQDVACTSALNNALAAIRGGSAGQRSPASAEQPIPRDPAARSRLADSLAPPEGATEPQIARLNPLIATARDRCGSITTGERTNPHACSMAQRRVRQAVDTIRSIDGGEVSSGSASGT